MCYLSGPVKTLHEYRRNIDLEHSLIKIFSHQLRGFDCSCYISGRCSYIAICSCSKVGKPLCYHASNPMKVIPTTNIAVVGKLFIECGGQSQLLSILGKLVTCEPQELAITTKANLTFLPLHWLLRLLHQSVFTLIVVDLRMKKNINFIFKTFFEEIKSYIKVKIVQFYQGEIFK